MVRMGVGGHGEDLSEREVSRSQQYIPAAGIRTARDHGEVYDDACEAQHPDYRRWLRVGESICN
jgi:hypothetical protein